MTQKHIKSAVDALNKKDYTAYMRCLDDLGNFLNVSYKRLNSTVATSKNKQERDADKLKWIKNLLQKSTLDNINLSLHNPLVYCAFEEAWLDEYFKNNKPDLSHLRFKTNLNRSTRNNINVGMLAVSLAVRKQEKFPDYRENIKTLDRKALSAIKSYKTKKQQRIAMIGKAIAFILSLICSITSAAAVAIAITTTAWHLSVIILVTTLVFANTLTGNWLTFGKTIPTMLNDIFGKDKLFEGWINYHNYETGKSLPISENRKKAMVILSFVAFILSIATGAVTYQFVIGLGGLKILSFLGIGTIISSTLLTPLGIGIATIFCLANMALMIKPITDMLKEKNFTLMLKKAFEQTESIFSKENNPQKSHTRLEIEKVITYTILALALSLSLFGLLALQIQGSGVLGGLLNKTFSIQSTIALTINYAVSISATLIGQVPYFLDSMIDKANRIASFFRNISHPKPTKKTTSHQETNSPIAVIRKIPGKLKEAIELVDPHKNNRIEAKNLRLKNLSNLEETLHKNQTNNKNKPRLKYYGNLFTPIIIAPSSPHPKPNNRPIPSIR